MKKVAFIFASMLFVASMALTSCTEKEEIVPDTPDDTTTPVVPPQDNYLVGTSWTCHVEGDYTYNYNNVDIYMQITDDASLDFLDETSGELFQDLYVYFPAMPSMSQSQTDTEEFIYTIDGYNIALNVDYYDEEEGDTVHYTYPAIYDPVAVTITVDMTGSGLDEITGSNLLVFTPRQEPDRVCPAKAGKSGRLDWQSLLRSIRK